MVMSASSSPDAVKKDAQSADSLLNSYQGFAGLPPLVGLESIGAAASKGLMVGESVDRLKRLHWSLRRLHQIFVSHITSEPIYELKMAYSLHAFYCAEHVGEFAGRVREMRQPPHGLEVAPDAALDLFFDEIAAAPSTAALLLGLYERRTAKSWKAGWARSIACWRRRVVSMERSSAVGKRSSPTFPQYPTNTIRCRDAMSASRTHTTWV
jgi:hypothetical protein